MLKKLLTLLFFFSILIIKAQDTINVNIDRTVVIIMPDSITMDELGSPDYIGKREANKYAITSKLEDAFTSSLFIETADGNYYSFVLKYTKTPKKLFYRITEKMAEGNSNYTVKKEEKKDAKILKNVEGHCQTIANQQKIYLTAGIQGRKSKFFLESIHTDADYMYYKVSAKNSSNIPLDINFIKFIITGKQGLSKKKNIQREEVQPILVLNEKIKRINPRQKESFVFAFPKFTIASNKNLIIEIWEKGGDRELSFKVPSRDILNARYIY